MQFYPLNPALTFRRIALIVAVVVALLCLAVPTFAQEAISPTPPPDIIEAPPVEEPPLVDIPGAFASILNTLMIVVTSGAVGAAFSPAVTAIVGVLKNLPLFGNFSSRTLLLLVNTLVWLGAAAAVKFGFQPQYTSLMQFIATLLPATTLFLTTLIGAPMVHEWAANKGLPVLGDKKTPEIRGEQLGALAGYVTHSVDSSGGVTRTTYTPFTPDTMSPKGVELIRDPITGDIRWQSFDASGRSGVGGTLDTLLDRWFESRREQVVNEVKASLALG